MLWQPDEIPRTWLRLWKGKARQRLDLIIIVANIKFALERFTDLSSSDVGFRGVL
jgi:hypothetical protein